MSDVWSLVDFYTTSETSEIVADILWSRGVVAIEEVTMTDSIVVLRTSMGDDPTTLIEAVHSTFPDVASEIVTIARSVADTWREHATPTRINEEVVLVPAWIVPPTDGLHIFVEPLDTFGLGNHPTTVLALRLALRWVAKGSTVFDLGSGSGVLSVGVAKLLDCAVTAYDIADTAREALRINCELNNVESIRWREGITGTSSQCVLANILAPVLIAESQTIADALEPDGIVILSGMRDEQVAGVLAHYETLTEIERESLDGWTAVVLRRT